MASGETLAIPQRATETREANARGRGVRPIGTSKLKKNILCPQAMKSQSPGAGEPEW